jgi:hypothetical protein
MAHLGPSEVGPYRRAGANSTNLSQTLQLVVALHRKNVAFTLLTLLTTQISYIPLDPPLTRIKTMC